METVEEAPTITRQTADEPRTSVEEPPTSAGGTEVWHDANTRHLV